ncbi:response regulator receiver protein [Edaphobacter aggregans]|uniref:Response regulator receiver protein n=1 Tax=Edaphobacter aggregans TaxID=570835 RepID=A0A3R9R3W2_9BACT|nr:response regulator [Edaphobacter aggregans]RSL17331.1 response regulator receiver protein [Edaphobacter aggregans]
MLQIGLGSMNLGNSFVPNLTVDLSHDAEATEVRAARPRVLIVDDEKLIADTCAEILEDAGFHTMTAYDGFAAMDMVAEFQPDYLLTDVLMPRMNGVELAIYVNKMLPKAKILLFSGQAGISDILLQGHKQGYEFELLAKPLHPVKLIERLQKQQR